MCFGWKNEKQNTLGHSSHGLSSLKDIIQSNRTQGDVGG
jgi:hypothetical protein